MKPQTQLWMLVGALLLVAPHASHAQETLGGLGAAGAAGAALGATGAGGLSSGRITRGMGSGSGSGSGMDMGDGTDPRGGGSGSGSGSAGGPEGAGGAAAPPKRTPPPLQTFSPGTGESYVRDLLAASPAPLPAPQSRQRTPRGQARYSSRVSKQTKKQRTKEVLGKYKIPAVRWEAAYLPQDRYKFGKMWRFVSTETDRFYYSPSAMARKRFNPNRVIGFYSFQDALAAGYRPDPVSKPAPGAQIAHLARLYRGKELYDFVEYVYAGQVAPEAFLGVYNYATSVENTLRPTRARPYIGLTVSKILDAALTGDKSGIPIAFTSKGPVYPAPPATATTGEGTSSSGEDPRMSGRSGEASRN